jgi:hypothetical protein
MEVLESLEKVLRQQAEGKEVRMRRTRAELLLRLETAEILVKSPTL